MRLYELEINNIRGIHHLKLEPKGRNLVIWGPNGSGKSAVVDAIDFLLTGKILRLTGKGTGDISLNKHGHHIDCGNLDEVSVRAKVLLQGMKEPIEIKRNMNNPSKLEYDESIKEDIEEVIKLAQQGQHILTRREILKYITADSNTRAKEIQALMNITEIENIRKTLVTVNKSLQGEYSNAENILNRTKEQIKSTINEKTFNENFVLEFVNKNRKVLGGTELSDTNSQNLKIELKPPVFIDKKKNVNVKLLKNCIDNLVKVLSEEQQQEIIKADTKLRNLLMEIQNKFELFSALQRLRLTELGIKLMNEDGNCPLCDTLWETGKLLKYLEKRISDASIAKKYQKEISTLSEYISNLVNKTIANIQSIIGIIKPIELKNEIETLEIWLKDLNDFAPILSTPMERYLSCNIELKQIQKMLAPSSINQTFINIQSILKDESLKSTPEQEAWDNLTKLGENLKALEKAHIILKNANISKERGKILLDSFVNSKNKVLSKLYETIKDRFEFLYKRIHKTDESKFKAKITPTNTGLNIEVGFYDRGIYPPNALHSEGHQDTMGLCLFLALSEHLTRGLIDLIVLDDVIMSVDTDHRRQICDLLATEFPNKQLATQFPNKQFLITTHDEIWAKQLKTDKVVTSKGIVKFHNWTIEIGPQIMEYKTDIWKQIEKDLENNDVKSAASKLRWNSEGFFGELCDNIKAKVTYKLSGRYELGDFISNAIKQYRALLKEAVKVAKSWEKQDNVEMLGKIDNKVKQISEHAKIEQWIINDSVHYNNWANFSVNDFQPVVDAFQALYGLFICDKCGNMIYVNTEGSNLSSIRCQCGEINWNLRKK